MTTPAQKAGILSEALPYLRAFHGKTLVVRFGGEAMSDAKLKEGFARDLALLRLVGMKPIVVHGGGWGIDALLLKMGMEPQRYHGHRITDAKTLTVVEMALSELNQELTSLINQHGGRAVGVDGQDGRFIHARPMVLGGNDPDAPDLGFLGDVESIDTGYIDLLLSRGFIPVVIPIGVGADGTTYHINSDLLSGQLARALEAEKLILMTNVAGVKGRNGKRRSRSSRRRMPRRWCAKAWCTAAWSRASRRHCGRCAKVCAPCTSSTAACRARCCSRCSPAEGVGTALRADTDTDFFADSKAYLAT